MKDNRKPLILNVDDNDAGRYVTTRILQRAGFEVQEAATGGEALRLAEECPDLILLDVKLPDISGFEVCRQIKTNRRMADITVVHLSAAFVGDDDRSAGLEQGADGYLTQPVDTKVLVATINAFLRMKTTEQALRESEERFTQLAVQSSTIAWEVDVQGLYIYVSHVSEAVLGYRPDELVGRMHFYDLHPESGREAFKKAAFAVFDRKEPFLNLENAAQTKDGRHVWFSTNGIPLLNTDGTLRAYRGSDTDITESWCVNKALIGILEDEQRARASLQESEERFRVIFEHSTVGMSLMAPDGKFLQVNKAFADMLGYAIEEIQQLNFAQITHPDDVAKSQECIRVILAGVQTTYRFEKRYIHKSGAIVWVDISTTLLRDEQGTPLYLITSIVNITERKKAEAEKTILEAQFQQAQKLEAVGLLTGGIAHDFNNLLTTIIGNAQLAMMEVGKNSPLHEFLEDINGAGERAAALIRQLLAFSRKQILQPEVANLNEVIGNMDRMLQRVIQENIEIKTILSPDIGQVYIDIGQMEQVLMNLAVNARDVMPEGGKLIFETSNAELDETYARNHIGVTPGPYVMLAVTDTGIGMTKEVQARIFEPFFTTKEKGKGTGLGLSTVYGIIKQSKGNIWVYSEPGKGSTFKVYLPRVEETVSIVEEVEKVAESLQGSETILLVEDDGMVRNTTLKILQNYGYSVLCARDAEEAFNLCRQHQEPVQLMLTDVVMPGMSGRELAKRLEVLCPEMKVLFMSGYTDNAIVHSGLLDKGIAFIPKPFTPVDLARKVREVLDR